MLPKYLIISFNPRLPVHQYVSYVLSATENKEG